MRMTNLCKSELGPTLFDLIEGGSVNNSLIRKQTEILKKCTRTGKDVESALRDEGLTYEDLRYEFDEPLPNTSKLYRTLADFQTKRHGVPVISFFSGAGGLDLGFEAAGFDHLGSFEINKVFCETLRINRPHWRVLGPPDHTGDVSQLDVISKQIGRLVGSARIFEGVFIGGPPCQPFSIAANQRFNKSGKNFKRVGYAHEVYGNLLFKFIALIKRFRPTAFLIENVPGLSDVDGGVQLQQAIKSLAAAGYNIGTPCVLNAVHYFVPQQRLRLFIVGSRANMSFRPPRIAHEVIPCSAVFSTPTDGVANHVTRKHKPESLLRYMKLSYGERDHLGRVDRLNPRVPAKTVIAGGTAGGGRSHLHPRIPRTISVREAARLQSFPDDYIFTGPSARQFTQVGNAVPPVLAAQLADALKRSFFA